MNTTTHSLKLIMSNKKYTQTPDANDLNVYDPNANQPSEPPPSYDEAISAPSSNIDTPQQMPQKPPQRLQRPNNEYPVDSKYSRPAAPPPNSNNISVPPMMGTSTGTSTSTSSSFSSTANFGPNGQTTTTTTTTSATGKFSASSLPKPTPINPNPYLPWSYPASYRCAKCENTGYKTKNGHPCKKCWKEFRPKTVPPSTKAELERLVKHKPQPKPINSNVVKLPPGTMAYSRNPMTSQPLMVQPGDPRIGGVLCPKCNGRGLVHFFLDLERCTKCNGLGRIGYNGRQL